MRIKLMVIIVLFAVYMFSSEIFGGENANDTNKTMRLKELCISCDSIILKVLTDMISNDSIEKSGCFYVMYINDFDNGLLLKLNKFNEESTPPCVIYDGYSTYLDRNFLIKSYSSNSLPFVYPQKEIVLYNFSGTVSPVDTQYYYIKNGVYAKFDSRQGWLWSDGMPDL